jgi:hypothetical protein
MAEHIKDDLQANVEEAGKRERLVDDIFALFIFEIVGNPEVLEELKKLHRKKKQNSLSRASALHRRHLVMHIPGNEEAENTETWQRALNTVEGWWRRIRRTSRPIFVETHRYE